MPTSIEQAQARRESPGQVYQNNPRFLVDVHLPDVSKTLQHFPFLLKLLSANLQMGHGYDYNRFISDPDEVFKESANNFTIVVDQFRHAGNQAEQDQRLFERYEGYLREAVVRTIHASNALENAGVDLDVTGSLVEDILNGKGCLVTLGRRKMFGMKTFPKLLLEIHFGTLVD